MTFYTNVTFSLLKKYHRDGKPFFEGQVSKVYNDNEVVAQELFNNAAVFMGNRKAVRNAPPLGTENWKLFNLSNYVGEYHDLSCLEKISICL